MVNENRDFEASERLGLPAGAKITPMLRQWMDAKSKAKDAILLFRMGDFYELFGEDANAAAPVLDLVLTSRDKVKSDSSVPMAGFPWHAASAHISKLVSCGFKIAICDQLEDPSAAKGIVKRGITRVVTPGTILEEDGLAARANNYLVGLIAEEKAVGLVALDLSCGEFLATTCGLEQCLFDELARLNPPEIVVAASGAKSEEFRRVLSSKIAHKGISIEVRPQPRTLELVDSLGAYDRWFDEGKNKNALFAGELLLNYLKETQGCVAGHLTTPKPYLIDDQLLIDATTRAHLDLGEGAKRGKKVDTLMSTLDYTKTAMGGRFLARILVSPSTSLKLINARHDLVSALIDQTSLQREMRELLSGVSDIERLVSKCAIKRATPRDLSTLRDTLAQVSKILALTSGSQVSELVDLVAKLNFPKQLFTELIRALADEPPSNLKDGGIFAPGFDAALDELCEFCTGGRTKLAAIEAEERKATGIASLKVKYTRVFGYYLEVTKTHLSKVPGHYIRKQTIANGERFVTEELGMLEAQLASADGKRRNKEEELFEKLCFFVDDHAQNLNEIARALAFLDAMASFAEASVENQYVRPRMLNKDAKRFEIKDGRHPVMEVMNQKKGEVFVQNDLNLDAKKSQMLLITGPNMGGKSTIMRQVALIQLMAQAGSFVPAKSATLSICDRIFSRLGAADDLLKGRSTFMVEMAETAHILKHATPHSLVLLDEIGRGTSTFDGLSLAWAVAEHIYEHVGARTLFATHYHELTALSDKLDRLVNLHVAVCESKGNIRFSYRLLEGHAAQSYGIHVAKLAGLPKPVLKKAAILLRELEKKGENSGKKGQSIKRSENSFGPGDEISDDLVRAQLNLFGLNPAKVIMPQAGQLTEGNESVQIMGELISLDIGQMTPIECLNKLHSLQIRAKKLGV